MVTPRRKYRQPAMLTPRLYPNLFPDLALTTGAMHQLPIQTLLLRSLFPTLYAPGTTYAKFNNVFNIILAYLRV